MPAPHMFTLDALTLDDEQIECSLAVICSCREDPDLPWKGVLCGSTLHGSRWIDRPLHMTGHAEEGCSLEGYLTIDPVRLPSGDLRLHGQGQLKVTTE